MLWLRLILGILLSQTAALTTYNVSVLLPKGSQYTPAIKTITTMAKEDLDTSLVDIELKYYNTTNHALDTHADVCKIISQDKVPVVLSFGDSSRTTTEADLLSYFHIPIISTTATNPYLKLQADKDYLMLMAPSDTYQADALFALLRYHNWLEVSILSSVGDKGSYGLMDLIYLQQLVTRNERYIVKNIQHFNVGSDNEYSDIRKKLKIISDSLSKVVILNCDPSHGKIVFKIAHEMGLMDAGFVWIVTDVIAGQPEQLEINGKSPRYYEGIIGMVPSLVKGIKYTEFRDRYIAADKRNNQKDITIFTMLTYDAIGIIHKALLDRNLSLHSDLNCETQARGKVWDDGSKMRNALVDVGAWEGVSGTSKFAPDGSSDRDPTFDVLSFVETGFLKVGSWNNVSGINIDGKVTFLGGQTKVPSSLANTLSGRHLRIGMVAEPPFSFKNTTNEGCIDNYSNPTCWYGFSIELNNRLAKDLNYTYELVQPLDSKYGGFNVKEGVATGMISDILGGRIDFIGTSLAMDTERGSVIDFTFTFGDDTSASIVRGMTASKNPFFFLSSFEPFVWGMIILMIFVCSLVIYLTDKISPYGKYGRKIHALQTCKCDQCTVRRIRAKEFLVGSLKYAEFECQVEQAENEDTLEEFCMYNTAWRVCSAYMGNRGANPTCASGKFMLLAWWFFAMIISALYTANLAANLTYSQIGVPVDDVRDLLKQTELDWGVVGGRITQSRLLHHVDKTYGRVVREGKILANLGEAKQKVLKGNFAFIDERNVLEYNFKEDCDMAMFTNPIQSTESAFGLPINSPYKGILNHLILKYREDEYFTELMNEWFNKDSTCVSTSMGSDSALQFETIAGLFYIFELSVAICVCLVIIESFYAAVEDSRNSGHSIWSSLGSRFKLKLHDIYKEWFVYHRKNRGQQNGKPDMTKVQNL